MLKLERGSYWYCQYVLIENSASKLELLEWLMCDALRMEIRPASGYKSICEGNGIRK